MKRIIKNVFCFWVLLFCAQLIFCLNLSAKTVFKMNHQFPETAAGSKIDQWFVDEIERATNGEVKIKIFWSNRLGEANENLMLLKNAAIDMAAMSAGYFPEELPFFSAPNSIPMGMDNICQSSEIMAAFMTQIPIFKKEAAEHNIRPLFFHLLNPYLLVTKNPVKRFSDLKRMRIRIWGKDMPRLVKAAGGKPVKLFLPDIYEALKRGVIDGCPFSVDLMVSYKVYELAKHVTEVVMWEGPSWGVWISEKSWQKLPLHHQKVILKTAEKARQMEIPLTHEAERNARSFLKDKGITFHPFQAAELAKWKEVNPDFFDDFIQKMEKTGKGDAARETVKLWKSMRSRIRCP
jgi:TRAP-type C4-dicarboxylate transport system substrate-binding protein